MLRGSARTRERCRGGEGQSTGLALRLIVEIVDRKRLFLSSTRRLLPDLRHRYVARRCSGRAESFFRAFAAPAARSSASVYLSAHQSSTTISISMMIRQCRRYSRSCVCWIVVRLAAVHLRCICEAAPYAEHGSHHGSLAIPIGDRRFDLDSAR